MAWKPTNVTGSVHINGVAPKHDTTSINRGLEPSDYVLCDYDDYMLCKVTLGVLKGASKLNVFYYYY